MAVEYCNLTTDLRDAYHDIELYKSYTTINSTSWEQVGATNVYKLDQAGYTEMVFEDGVELTAGSDTTPDAGEFYYDATTDILYVQTTGSGDPSALTMQSGLDWNNFKARCRNDAQSLLESHLQKIYAIPFQKIADPTVEYNSRDYPYLICRMAAFLTCAMIIRKTNPEDPAADRLERMVDNPNPEIGEKPGFVQRIYDGEVTLSTQRTAREAGGWNFTESLDANSTGVLQLSGVYRGSTEQVWRLQIDTAGAPGTATYKLSFDDGGTYDYTLQETRDSDSDNRRAYLGSGVYATFTGTFVLNDYFRIQLFPSTDAVTSPRVGNIKLDRG